mgnify:CR=1 FL=1
MIQTQSIVKIVDNSGAQWGQCIRVLGKPTNATATIGDLIIISIKKARPLKKAKKKDIWTAIIVRTAKEKSRISGTQIRFNENACVLVESKINPEPIGTRLFGPIPGIELRKAKQAKCLLLARKVV